MALNAGLCTWILFQGLYSVIERTQKEYDQNISLMYLRENTCRVGCEDQMKTKGKEGSSVRRS